MIPEQQCSKCGEVKPVAGFVFRKQTNRLHTQCRDCVNERERARYAAMPLEKRKEIQRAGYLRNKVRKFETRRKWRASHREIENAAAKRRREKNLELSRAKERDYCRRNRVQKNAATRAWASNNRDKQRAFCAKWRSKVGNRAKAVAATRNWQRRNPEKVKIYGRRGESVRRARESGSVVDLRQITEWETLWRAKKIVRCYWCFGRFAPSQCASDHVVALAIGGAHSIGNLCISCWSCNSSKRANTIAQWNQRISEPVLL